MIRLPSQAVGLLIALSLVAAGCSGGGGDPAVGDADPQIDTAAPSDTGAPGDTAVGPTGDGFELVGVWTNNYGGTETFTEDAWDSGFGVVAISSYDNDANWVVMQSPEDDEYTPNQYSKTVWLEEEEGVVYTCTVSYGLETLEEAEEAEDTSDATDPLNVGCKGFGWTQLTAAE
jgi:hypothetical protein